ncbi:hypothetical protein [Micromonospora sp. NPDC002575]|uniref:hypothetical protein n=1 Tax=Micromonospora sp. NPDC002575 TaxID=3364222 RepID=UPI0036B6A1B7
MARASAYSSDKIANGSPPSLVTLIYDSGPNLDFNGVQVNCREDEVGPDSDCGQHPVGGPVISPSTPRWDSGLVYGNKLVDANDYFATVTGTVIPQGYPTYTVPELRSLSFYCGTNNVRCVFP